MKVCRARLLIIGQDRAGKTILIKSLLGLPFNPDEPSTEVLEVNPSKFDFSVEQVVDWKAVDSSEDKQARPEDRSVARLVASNMTKEKTNEKQVSPKKEKMKIDEEHAIEPTQVYKSQVYSRFPRPGKRFFKVMGKAVNFPKKKQQQQGNPVLAKSEKNREFRFQGLVKVIILLTPIKSSRSRR